MPGSVSHHVAGKVIAKQGKVAYQVKDFVPRRLIGMPKCVVDRAVAAEYEEIGGSNAGAQSLAPELDGFLLQEESAATGDLVIEALGIDALGVHLSADGRLGTIVQEVADLEVAGARIEGERGAVLRQLHRRFDGVAGSSGGLDVRAGGRQCLNQGPGRAIEAGRLRTVELHDAVVDSHAGQGRNDVLNESDVVGRASD